MLKQFRPLCIYLSKMTTYRKDFDVNKFMSFLIKDNRLLKKYNGIWGKVKDSFNREFDIKPVYNKKNLKKKLK